MHLSGLDWKTGEIGGHGGQDAGTLTVRQDGVRPAVVELIITHHSAARHSASTGRHEISSSQRQSLG